MTTMKRELTKARNEGRKIIYIDETMTTRKTVPEQEWTRRKENAAVVLAKLEEPTLALLCGISKEEGLEHYRIFEHSVNIDRFIDYLKGVKEANSQVKIAIFMDNLSVHTSKQAKKVMKELSIKWIYSVPYEPQ